MRVRLKSDVAGINGYVFCNGQLMRDGDQAAAEFCAADSVGERDASVGKPTCSLEHPHGIAQGSVRHHSPAERAFST